MREGNVPIEALKAYTKDNVPVFITGTLFYQVRDSYKACFEAQNVIRQVHQVGTSAARSIIGTMDYDEIIADRNTINKRLTEKIGTVCANWGVDCTKFEIQDFNPQNRDV
jgi:regulator of protease activity HflC (stomatin/prohibitin superfamily)